MRRGACDGFILSLKDVMITRSMNVFQVRKVSVCSGYVRDGEKARVLKLWVEKLEILSFGKMVGCFLFMRDFLILVTHRMRDLYAVRCRIL